MEPPSLADRLLDAGVALLSSGLWCAVDLAAWAWWRLQGAEQSPLSRSEDVGVDEQALKLQRQRAVPQQFAVAVPGQPSGQPRPLRLLCLHGSGSNNDLTLFQLAHLGLLQRAHVALLHGPCQCQPHSSSFSQLSDQPFRCWWEKPLTSSKLRRTLRYVVRYVAQHGPFDGLFGFSQGAAVVTLLSLPGMLQALGQPLSPASRWRFVVCAGGVSLGIPEAAELLGRPGDALEPACIPLRSIHLVGRRDLCRASSVALAGLYGRPAVHMHGHGHELPAALQQDRGCSRLRDEFLEREAAEAAGAPAAGAAEGG